MVLALLVFVLIEGRAAASSSPTPAA
jgi:hypothetical protein